MGRRGVSLGDWAKEGGGEVTGSPMALGISCCRREQMGSDSRRQTIKYMMNWGFGASAEKNTFKLEKAIYIN